MTLNSEGRRRQAGVVVRDATAGDWPRIWPFFHEIVSAGATFPYERDLTEPEGRRTWMQQPPGRTAIAAGPADDVLGSAVMGPNRGGPGAHVATASFMVDPRHTGKAVGRALVRDALGWATGQGFRAMQFNAVAETNVHAVRLYESLGFAVVGTVPEAFEHPTQGFVGLHVMHRTLGERV